MTDKDRRYRPFEDFLHEDGKRHESLLRRAAAPQDKDRIEPWLDARTPKFQSHLVHMHQVREAFAKGEMPEALKQTRRLRRLYRPLGEGIERSAAAGRDQDRNLMPFFGGKRKAERKAINLHEGKRSEQSPEKDKGETYDIADSRADPRQKLAELRSGKSLAGLGTKDTGSDGAKPEGDDDGNRPRRRRRRFWG